MDVLLLLYIKLTKSLFNAKFFIILLVILYKICFNINKVMFILYIS